MKLVLALLPFSLLVADTALAQPVVESPVIVDGGGCRLANPATAKHHPAEAIAQLQAIPLDASVDPALISCQARLAQELLNSNKNLAKTHGELIQKQTQIANYLAVSSGLSSCARVNDEQRALILQGMGDSDPSTLACRADVVNFAQLSQMVGHARESMDDVQKDMNKDPSGGAKLAGEMNFLNTELYYGALLPAVKSYWHARMRYGAGSIPSVADGVKEICEDRTCTPEQSAVITEYSKKAIQELTGIQRLSPEQVAKDLNDKIGILNADLARASDKFSPRIRLLNAKTGETTTDVETDESKRLRAEAQAKFRGIMDSPEFRSLFTDDELKKHFDELFADTPRIQAQDRVDDQGHIIAKLGKAYQYLPLPEVKPAQVQAAMRTANHLSRDYLADIDRIYKDEKKGVNYRPVQEYVKSSPEVVGAVLVAHPELTPIVCAGLQQVQGDKNAKSFAKWGLVAASFIFLKNGTAGALAADAAGVGEAAEAATAAGRVVRGARAVAEAYGGLGGATVFAATIGDQVRESAEMQKEYDTVRSAIVADHDLTGMSHEQLNAYAERAASAHTEVVSSLALGVGVPAAMLTAKEIMPLSKVAREMLGFYMNAAKGKGAEKAEEALAMFRTLAVKLKGMSRAAGEVFTGFAERGVSEDKIARIRAWFSEADPATEESFLSRFRNASKDKIEKLSDELQRLSNSCVAEAAPA